MTTRCYSIGCASDLETGPPCPRCGNKALVSPVKKLDVFRKALEYVVSKTVEPELAAYCAAVLSET